MYTCSYCHPASDQSASSVLIPNYISIMFAISCCYFLVDMCRFKGNPDLKVIKLEYILRLKIKRNDWLIADTCPQSANHCTLF